MNGMSLLHHRRTGHYCTPTRPVSGLALMLLYSLCVPLQLTEYRLLYQGLMITFILVLSAGGVVKHLMATGRTGYASASARWAAITINCYGVLLTCASLGLGR